MRWQLGRKLNYAILSDLHSCKAEYDTLKNASQTCRKRHPAVVSIFREDSERRSQLVCIALLEHLESHIRVTKTGIQHRYDGVAHCRTVRVQAGMGVVVAMTVFLLVTIVYSTFTKGED